MYRIKNKVYSIYIVYSISMKYMYSKYVKLYFSACFEKTACILEGFFSVKLTVRNVCLL